MKESVDGTQVADALGALRQELARLGERVTALEAAVAVRLDTAAAPAESAPMAQGLTEELLVVISAAIAAFFGKKPHIRQVRFLGSAAWAQQGRVTIQASHALSVQHG